MFDTFAAAMMVIVFLVPGYIWYVVQGTFSYLDRGLEWQKFALTLITRSTFIYLPFSPWLYRAWTTQLYASRPFTAALVAILLVLVLPASLGFLLAWVARKRFFFDLAKLCKVKVFSEDVPTAWDEIFSKIEDNTRAIVKLKSGGTVEGRLGPSACMSTDPAERDLYISPIIRDDYDSEREIRGLYIKADEILTIEIIKPKLPETKTEEKKAK